jgi:hypothetical protein
MDKTKGKRDVATPKLVYLEWVDAVADLGWEANCKAELHHCHTVGFIVDETKDAICIAATWSITMSNARMHIPKAWITKRKAINLETKQRKTKGKAAPAMDQGPDHQGVQPQ